MPPAVPGPAAPARRPPTSASPPNFHPLKRWCLPTPVSHGRGSRAAGHAVLTTQALCHSGQGAFLLDVVVPREVWDLPTSGRGGGGRGMGQTRRSLPLPLMLFPKGRPRTRPPPRPAHLAALRPRPHAHSDPASHARCPGEGAVLRAARPPEPARRHRDRGLPGGGPRGGEAAGEGGSRSRALHLPRHGG